MSRFKYPNMFRYQVLFYLKTNYSTMVFCSFNIHIYAKEMDH